MQIGLAPLRLRRLLPTQRITVLLNGLAVSQLRLGSDTAVMVDLPAELAAGTEKLMLSFVTPDAVPLSGYAGRAGDYALGFQLDWIVVEPFPASPPYRHLSRWDELDQTKPLAVSERFLDEQLPELPRAIESALEIPLTDLLWRFESIGDNCGFGLVQRKSGLEVLGLLRFAGTPLKALLRALDDDFAAASNPSEISVDVNADDPHREYLVNIKRYGIRWHTFVRAVDSTADDISRTHIQKLTYLRRKFFEGLGTGRKVYVVTRSTARRVDLIIPTVERRFFRYENPEPLRLAEVLPVFGQLAHHASNTLLYVVPCQNGRRSGTVELLAPGLMRGYIETLAISEDTTVADHGEWLRIVANAWILDQASCASVQPAHASQPHRGETAGEMSDDAHSRLMIVP